MIRKASKTGGQFEVSLSPAMPAMTRPMQKTLTAALGSPKRSMPIIAVPTAPMPVHTAYAVPIGMDLSEKAMKTMLRTRETIVMAVGSGFVKPSESLRLNAHAISKKPAVKRSIQPITFSRVLSSIGF